MGRATRRFAGWVLYALYLLVIVEATLQLFYYFNAGQWLATRMGRPLFAPNRYSGYWNKPNLDMLHRTNEFTCRLYTNSQGFRVSAAREEYAKGRNPDRYRIMLLGPSFAYGWAVDYEQTFGNQLRLLLERGGFADRPIEVIIAGVPSLAPSNELNWYKNEGRLYEPDLVVQFVYGSLVVPPDPDLTTNEVSPDGYLLTKGLDFATRAREQLKKSSVVFYSWVLSTRLTTHWRDKDAPSEILGAGRELEVHGEFDPTSPEVVTALRYYDDLRRTVAAGGTRLLIVHFPLSYCVHRGDISRWRHLGVFDVDRQIAYEEAFCRYLSERGIECQNITQDLVREALRSEQRLYYWLDVHWTAAGNLAAARAVATHLLDHPARLETSNGNTPLPH